MGENSSLTKCLVNIPGHNVGPEESCEGAKNNRGNVFFKNVHFGPPTLRASGFFSMPGSEFNSVCKPEVNNDRHYRASQAWCGVPLTSDESDLFCQNN